MFETLQWATYPWIRSSHHHHHPLSQWWWCLGGWQWAEYLCILTWVLAPQSPPLAPCSNTAILPSSHALQGCCIALDCITLESGHSGSSQERTPDQSDLTSCAVWSDLPPNSPVNTFPSLSLRKLCLIHDLHRTYFYWFLFELLTQQFWTQCSDWEALLSSIDISESSSVILPTTLLVEVIGCVCNFRD